ncbi:MAG: glycine zipper 2TM domain-containing protein [Gammaproteobacteria bacterium]|nr:glycine zipper 2TM domain-containing protein [Gammaproteobacteria bacterium]MCP5201069.1 glycine zipper 2TM domain-containing protein [Gammaproteobacteria bacterium]
MTTTLRGAAIALAMSTVLALSGCSGMSRQEKGTTLGAAAGGVAGAVISGGGALGTLGGAAVGGLIGHEVTEDDKK